MGIDKMARALARLEAGQPLYQLPNGQWKFGGNKFVPSSIAQRLPIMETHLTNRGWRAFKLEDNYVR